MIQALTEESLHIGSVKGYKSAWNILTTFAESVGMTATVILTDTKPLDANLIELWITDMRDTGTGAGVIASRLSAIKWCCEVNRKPLNLEATTVSRLMGAVMRSNSTVPNKAKPVTPANMRSFYDLCNTATPLVWHHRLMAIMLLCYTGFLRIGECITIQVNHLAFTPSHLTIFCPQRKGDRYRLGGEVFIARLPGSLLCPVAYLENYLKELPRLLPEDPIFPSWTKPNEAISYTTVRKHMAVIFKASGLGSAGLRTHSFRVGGATEAHNAGISDADAAKHGSWKDLLTYHGYVEPVVDDLLKVSQSLGI